MSFSRRLLLQTSYDMSDCQWQKWQFVEQFLTINYRKKIQYYKELSIGADEQTLQN